MLTKARIRQVRSLSDKTARSENGLFVAEGRKMVGEALAAGADIERIYLTGEEGAGGVDEAVRCGIVERVSDSEMERMSHLKNPFGHARRDTHARRRRGGSLPGRRTLPLPGRGTGPR